MSDGTRCDVCDKEVPNPEFSVPLPWFRITTQTVVRVGKMMLYSGKRGTPLDLCARCGEVLFKRIKNSKSV